jgi:hypothetical protein
MEILFLKICPKLRKHCVSITETDGLMPYNEEMGVYSEYHMQHTNTFSGQKSVYFNVDQ